VIYSAPTVSRMQKLGHDFKMHSPRSSYEPYRPATIHITFTQGRCRTSAYPKVRYMHYHEEKEEIRINGSGISVPHGPSCAIICLDPIMIRIHHNVKQKPIRPSYWAPKIECRPITNKYPERRKSPSVNLRMKRT
jgi:hypothetical protein